MILGLTFNKFLAFPGFFAIARSKFYFSICSHNFYFFNFLFHECLDFIRPLDNEGVRSGPKPLFPDVFRLYVSLKVYLIKLI